jgi:hypothetical protein
MKPVRQGFPGRVLFCRRPQRNAQKPRELQSQLTPKLTPEDPPKTSEVTVNDKGYSILVYVASIHGLVLQEREGCDL